MNGWTFQDFLNFSSSLIVAIGGAGAIILGLSKWFGGILADKLLAKDKAKYQESLEKLKSRYQRELEETKNELEKSKAQFLRYSEHQFGLYNEMWQSLMELKFSMEDLWERLDPEKLRSFSKQLGETKRVVEKKVLLIEEDHYKRLIKVLQDFEAFRFGKAKLRELRNKDAHQMSELNIDQFRIEQVIHENGEIKENLTTLLLELGATFRGQIKGTV